MRSAHQEHIPHFSHIPIELCRSTLVFRISNNSKADALPCQNHTPGRPTYSVDSNEESDTDIFLSDEEIPYKNGNHALRRFIFYSLLVMTAMLALNLLPL